LTQEGNVYTTAQPFGVNFDAQDVAQFVFALLESYPEAKAIFEQNKFYVVDDGREGDEERDSENHD
uniref:hypothetical protein n=1 Tax=Staphylococcus aureus TaxID=1280 RepID=UPI0020BE7FD8